MATSNNIRPQSSALRAEQSSTTNAPRAGYSFLVKPMYEGKSYPCYESGFNATREDSIRVIRMEDMRLGLEDCTPEEFREYLGKQPVFYFQERFAPECPGFEWNGFLLFAIRGKEDARKTALAHQDELHIILSFKDPDTDRYFILVDTESGGGTKEDFQRWQADIRDMVIKPYFHKPTGFSLDRYTRALVPVYYDIIDKDTLFGKPVEATIPCSVPQSSALRAEHSILALIKGSIARLFHKSA